MAENSEKRIALRLSEDDLSAMQKIADKEDLSLSQIVRRAIRAYLSTQKGKTKC